MRAFQPLELQNQRFLVGKDIKFTMVQITATGLKKSILDATAPMRAYFIENGVHNYEEQAQGTAHKKIIDTIILTFEAAIETKSSFYRPETKQGDPRMWIYKLTSYTRADDIHAIIAHDKKLYVINITRIDLEKCFSTEALSINPIKEFISSCHKQAITVSEELLEKFRKDSGVWHRSEITADTGIGRTIESLLGISMNSSKDPDYKGIELKSNREKRSSKKNVLFTQTPDWNISALKSGLEIVDHYGYNVGRNWKTLQNTVSCDKANSQNLILSVNEVKQLLEMQHQIETIKTDVAAWQLVNLHDRLKNKHKETFWIEVKNDFIDGEEYFCYSKIEHTKNPNVAQFDVLLGQSMITLDLMLHRPSGHGDTYSFKIKSSAKSLLFPESTIYDLLPSGIIQAPVISYGLQDIDHESHSRMIAQPDMQYEIPFE